MLDTLLHKAQSAQAALAPLSSQRRNHLLIAMADQVSFQSDQILKANHDDVDRARQDGLDGPRLARLGLSESKLKALSTGLRELAQIQDPLGRGDRWTLANGLILDRVRVPLGVIGLIYESRPGVTLEATALALKSGNAILLKGGREALATNQELVELWRSTLTREGLPQDLVQLISDTTRTAARELMHLTGLDLLIPRGGASLIRTVADQATVPVIETGVGNCHLYVDQHADLEMALKILLDGKMGNPSVCNALETVLIHQAITDAFIPRAVEMLKPYGVIWHGDQDVLARIPEALAAQESDWADEYLDVHIAAKVVDDLDQALGHIQRYGTRHSESIVTEHYPTGHQFLSRVDAAVVYWNASTRFSDGHEFGFGAEVGISTQKLHARGPMGLEALTTWKTLAYGTGQTRDLATSTSNPNPT